MWKQRDGERVQCRLATTVDATPTKLGTSQGTFVTTPGYLLLCLTLVVYLKT